MVIERHDTGQDSDAQIRAELINFLNGDPRIANKLRQYRLDGNPPLTRSVKNFLLIAGVAEDVLPSKISHASSEQRIQVWAKADEIVRRRGIVLNDFEGQEDQIPGQKPAKAPKRARSKSPEARTGTSGNDGKQNGDVSPIEPPNFTLEVSANKEDLLSFVLPQDMAESLYSLGASDSEIFPPVTEELRKFIDENGGSETVLASEEAELLWREAEKITVRKQEGLILGANRIVKEKIEAKGLKFKEGFDSPFDTPGHPDKFGIKAAQDRLSNFVMFGRTVNKDESVLQKFIEEAVIDLEIAHIRANGLEALSKLLSESRLPGLADYKTMSTTHAIDAEGFALLSEETSEEARKYCDMKFGDTVYPPEGEGALEDYAARVREVVTQILSGKFGVIGHFTDLDTLDEQIKKVQCGAEDGLRSSRLFYDDIGYLIASGIKDRPETEEPLREAELSPSEDFFPPAGTGPEDEIPVGIEPHAEEIVLPPSQPDSREPSGVRAVSRHHQTKVKERSEYVEKTRDFARRRRWLIAGVGGAALALIAGIGIGFMLDSDDKGDREFINTAVVRETVEKVFDEKLVPVNERLDRINERIDRVNERIDRLNERLANLENDVNRIDDKLDNFAANSPLGQTAVPATSGALTDDEARQVLDRMDGAADGQITITIDPNHGSGGVDTVDWASGRSLETGLFHPENPAIDGAPRWSLTNAIIDGDAAGNHWVDPGQTPSYGIEQDDIDVYQNLNVPLSPKASGIVNELRTPPPQTTQPGNPNTSADINGLRESAGIISRQVEAEAEIPVVINQNIDQTETDLGEYDESAAMSGGLNFEAGSGIYTATKQTALNTRAVSQNPEFILQGYSFEAKSALLVQRASVGAIYGEDGRISGSEVEESIAETDQAFFRRRGFNPGTSDEDDNLGGWIQNLLKKQQDEEERERGLKLKKEGRESVLVKLYGGNNL